MSEQKNLELERLVFFTDAVVAIAITLLALELKIHKTADGVLKFSDLALSDHKFLAFCLSFFNIAVFWKVHHQFFHYISRIDYKMFWYNITWLLFIVLLPFTTSLIGTYFRDVPAMFCYSANTFLVTVFQNQIWNYVTSKPQLLKKELDAKTDYANKVACRVAMFNGLSATLISFLSPVAAFIILCCRFPMILIYRKIFRSKAYSKQLTEN